MINYGDSPLICQANCLGNSSKWFKTTTKSTDTPADHPVCVEDCAGSNGVTGMTKWAATGADGAGEISCVAECNSNTAPFASHFFSLDHSTETESSGLTLTSQNENLLAGLKAALTGT